MLSAILSRTGELVKMERLEDTGLTEREPIVRFLRDQSLANYLRLDDFGLWSSLRLMTEARDADLAELAARLLNRRLYKAIDISARLGPRGGEASIARFRAELGKVKAERNINSIDLLEDQAARNPYKRRGYDSPDALAKVLIRRRDGRGYEDLSEQSKVVENLQQQSFFRVYARNESVTELVENLLEGIAK
jgi:hypothetical protein